MSTRPSTPTARASVVAALWLALGSAGAGAGTITGRIIDSSGVRSLQGAQVRILELGRTATAGADGSYRFTGVSPGRYTLTASYVGARTVEQTVALDDRETLHVDVGLGSDFDEDVLVVGQRANLTSALSRQRASDAVETVLTRDAVGLFPDQNVAEAMRRVSGVNILNDQGEGRFVSVRGLDPNLNAASINGARVPAPEADVRSVALDVLPVEVIESIRIRKSLTPDMDADTIGASIEIVTTSALDRETSFFAVSAESAYSDLAGKSSPKGSFDFSTPLGERLGVAGGISYYDRRFATDNVEMDGWGVTDEGIVYADTVEYRDYDVERTRTGGSLSFDFQPAPSTALYLRTLHSEFEDQEFRRRLTFEMDQEPSAGSSESARFLSDDGEIEVIRDIKDRFEAQTITSVSLGGETFAGPWTFTYQASASRAKEEENGSLDPVEFARDFEDPGELDVTFDYRRMELPAFTVLPDDRPAFLDPAEYEFDAIERSTKSLSEDEEQALRFDVTRGFALERGELAVQVGGKSRRREKSFDFEGDVFDGFDGEFSLADVAGSQSYSLAPISPLPNGAAMRAFYGAHASGFELDPIESTFVSSIEDYLVEEDVGAVYALARYDNGRLRIVGGARYERTDNRIEGNRVELVEEGALRDGVVLDEDAVFVTPVRLDRDYDHVLPSVNVRYEPADDLVLRFALYQSLVRPGIGQLAPRFVIEESDGGEREGEFGNPDLVPFEADNFDFSAEWYFAENAVLQGGLFHKRIENFIAAARFDDVTFNGVFANEAVIPINGEKATVNGLELGYQQALTALAAPFDGVVLGFNYTYTDTEGRVGGRETPLPAASKSTFNAMLGYEKGRLSLRLAATYRDRYLDELAGEPEEDRYVKAHLQVDLSARYRLNDRLQLFADLINLGDEPYVAYQRGPAGHRLLQYEEYSWTGKLGVRASF